MKFSRTVIATAIACACQQMAYAGELSVTRVLDQNTSGNAISCLVLTDSLDGSPVLSNLRSYVALKNLDTGKELIANPMVNERSLCLAGLEFGTNYEVTLKAGLKAANGGDAVTKNASYSFKTIDSSESIRFLSGNVMSASEGERKVAVESINTDGFRVNLFKISQNAFSDTGVGSIVRFGDDSRWSGIQLVSKYGKLLGSKDYAVSGQTNQKSLTMIDLKDISSEVGSGVYFLMLTKTDFEPCDETGSCIDKADWSYDSLVLFKPIVISDMGVTSYSSPTGIDVAVRSINDAKPISGAKVSLISKSGDVLAVVSTDANGYAHFGKSVAGGSKAQHPAAVNVANGNDFYSIDIEQNPLFIEQKGSTVADLDTEFKVFSYTNRTLVRPGEKVLYEAIVRNAALNAADLKAAKLMIYRPDGVLAEETTLSNPKSGAFEHEYEFVKGSMLGSWRFVIGIGNKRVLSETVVQVDDFVPNSIEPAVVTKNKILQDNPMVAVHVDFTYGAPAPDISVGGSYILRQDEHPVEAYADYFFGPAPDISGSYARQEEIMAGETGSNGDLLMSLGEIEAASYPRKVNVILNYQDPNSKLLYTRNEFKLKYDGTMVGVKPGFDKENVNIADMSVILSDQKGNLQSGKVSYAIYKNHSSGQYVYTNGRWNYVSNEYQTAEAAGEIDVGADTKARIRQELLGGSYTIELRFGNEVTSTRFYVGSRSELDSNEPNRFELTADKESYKIGEKAVLEFDSAYAGYADLLLGLSDKKNLAHFEISKGHNKIEVPVTEALGKGGYALLTTYAASPNKYMGAQRTIGLAYLAVDMSDRTLKVSADIPETIKPNSSLDFKIKVDNADGETYATVALIDNGILAINHQKAPAPEKNIFGKNPFDVSVYDMYAFLMRSASQNGQGYGGDEDDEGLEADTLDGITKNLLSYYTVAVPVKDGVADVHFDINDVSTSATLMVSAWSPKKLGSYNKKIGVKDSAVSKLKAPYYMHDGAKLDAAFSVNNLSEKTGAYKYEISCSGTLSCNASGEMNVAAGAMSSVPVAITAKGKGPGAVDISVTGADYGYKTQKTIEVISPLSVMSESKIVVVKPGDTRTVTFSNTFADGSDVKAVLGKIPMSDTDKLLDSLMDGYASSVEEKSLAGLAALAVLSDLEKSGKADQTRLHKIQDYIVDLINQVQSRTDDNGHISGYFSNYNERYYASACAAEFLFAADKAGFPVTKSLLAGYQRVLLEAQNSDNHNAAAKSMNVLAKIGVNVKTNLVYRFDRLSEAEVVPAEAFALYAETLGLYGDKNRQAKAFDMGKIALNKLFKKSYQLTKPMDNEAFVKLVAEVMPQIPFDVNSLTHDTLVLIKTMLAAGQDAGIETLYSYLNSDRYYGIAGEAVLLDMSVRFKAADAQKQTLQTSKNAVAVKNDAGEAMVATVSAKGEIIKGAADSPVTYTLRYFNSKGVEIKGPLNLAVNDEVLVIADMQFARSFTGKISWETKVPSNMILMKNMTQEDMSRRFPALAKVARIFEPTISNGDTGFVSTIDVYNTGSVRTAYLLKAAHKGASPALMSSGFAKSLSKMTFSAYDKDKSFSVK